MALKKGIYKINGVERIVIADENESMADVLRRIGLTGVKVGCGTGMCGACRVTVGGKTRFACVEGPEFDGYEVDFDEAMRRQGQYRTEESEARENHKCRIGRGK